MYQIRAVTSTQANSPDGPNMEMQVNIKLGSCHIFMHYVVITTLYE